MTRRCKPGQRARVINNLNAGKVVVVVRYYRGEKVDGATWPNALFPWVITSLGAPMTWIDAKDQSRTGQSFTIVLDDRDLEPIDDDDSDDLVFTQEDKPKTAHQ